MAAIGERLPSNVKICTFGVPMKVAISVMLENAEQAQALIDAIDILIPLFEKPDEDPSGQRREAMSPDPLDDEAPFNAEER